MSADDLARLAELHRRVEPLLREIQARLPEGYLVTLVARSTTTAREDFAVSFDPLWPRFGAYTQLLRITPPAPVPLPGVPERSQGANP